ncbi:hypothetical protein QBC39DRAFT_47711 [Podospora conica]|nr:hypothetical protein QBC39DRAFT_47711 [Schizothecium conicum]
MLWQDHCPNRQGLEIFLGHVAHIGANGRRPGGWERRFPHSEREEAGRQGRRSRTTCTAVAAAGVERGESPTTRGPVDAQRVGCPAAILVCRVAPRQACRPPVKRGLGRRSSTTMHLSRTRCRKRSQGTVSRRRRIHSACVACQQWTSARGLAISPLDRARHRRGLGPARDEPPSQNRVHGCGSVCCVMRSCPARVGEDGMAINMIANCPVS